MFEETVIRLLEGAFVCRTATPDLFEFLEEESNRRQVDGYLTQIGRRLAVTAHGQAYYAAYQKIGPSEKKQIQNLFKEIKYELRPVLKFLALIMGAERSDQPLVVGDVVDFPKALLKISESPRLEEDLRGFAAIGREFASNSEANLHTSLQNVFKYMVKKDYLIQMDQGDRYEVTGKIDYFYEVLSFLSENEQAIREEMERESEAETGRLL